MVKQLQRGKFRLLERMRCWWGIFTLLIVVSFSFEQTVRLCAFDQTTSQPAPVMCSSIQRAKNIVLNIREYYEPLLRRHTNVLIASVSGDDELRSEQNPHSMGYIYFPKFDSTCWLPARNYIVENLSSVIALLGDKAFEAFDKDVTNMRINIRKKLICMSDLWTNLVPQTHLGREGLTFYVQLTFKSDLNNLYERIISIEAAKIPAGSTDTAAVENMPRLQAWSRDDLNKFSPGAVSVGSYSVIPSLLVRGPSASEQRYFSRAATSWPAPRATGVPEQRYFSRAATLWPVARAAGVPVEISDRGAETTTQLVLAIPNALYADLGGLALQNNISVSRYILTVLDRIVEGRRAPAKPAREKE